MPNRNQIKSDTARRLKGARSSANITFQIKPWYHNIPEKELIADLRRVARLLGARTLTMGAYRSKSKFGPGTLCDRFGSWNLALKKAGLEPSHHHDVRDAEIVADIRRVAGKLKATRLTGTRYHSLGLYRHGLIRKRFGNWPNAIHAAGLLAVQYKNVPVRELFENLENVWLTLGRQPTRADMVYPVSKFGIYTYDVRYHGFRNALIAWVKWKEKNRNRKSPAPPPRPAKKMMRRYQSGRKIGLQLRYRILKRDDFKCRACGRSPATHRNVSLQVDHIKPWSAGGETVVTNLQTLCEKCNRGKSNF